MTVDPTPTLDVVIVNWNGGALLRACLASLAAAEAQLGGALSLRVVVVDNASRDGSLEDLPALRHGPAVIANPDNQGFGRACNAGAARGTRQRSCSSTPMPGSRARASPGPARP
ncbi:glycosyltransferase family 2 protein [Methylobacterium aquaticum]|uniref:glycosyltransferase family 2 protein n=1 Tax=Methylobacterium aquaticum TaxID=270351 RepID=UPI0032B2D3E6